MHNLELQEQLENAINLRNNGRELEAVAVYTDHLNALPLEEYGQRGYVCEEIGVCYQIMNDLDSARQWYQDAAELFKKANDSLGTGNVQRDLGLTYHYESNYDKALEWLYKSEETLKGLVELPALGITIVKIGATLRDKGDLDEAVQKIQDGLRILRTAEEWNSFFEMTALLELGAVHFYKKEYQNGIDRLREALALLLETDELETQVRRVGEIYLLLAWCYMEQERISQAVSSFVKAMNAWESMDAATTELVIEKGRVEELLKRIEDLDEELGSLARESYENIL